MLFCTVLALPNASRTGFDSNICSFTRCTCLLLPVTAAMYCMMNLELSVLPEPDSPLMMMHWLTPSEMRL